VAIAHEELFHGRLVRPLEVGAELSFFASPAEQAPDVRVKEVRVEKAQADEADVPEKSGESAVDLLRRLAAERAELPLDLVTEDSKPLDELHLSSVTVMHIIDQATQRLGGYVELIETLEGWLAEVTPARSPGPAPRPPAPPGTAPARSGWPA